MDIENKLKDQGWYLTEGGIKKVRSACTNEESKNNVHKLVQIAKDMDFRDIAGGGLGKKRDDDSISGKMVLQLQKIRVISAPKANEESRAAPRMMQLEFTDGQTTISALEMEYIKDLNLDTPPGTKIYFRSEKIKVSQGNVELKPSDIQVLGGIVESLVEKWKVQRTMNQYTKMGRPMSGASGPPPWIAFGQKIEASKSLITDRNFKSLQAADKDKDSKENDEFLAMRNEAIANANKALSKKIFGGGGQVLLDHNVKKILEKGYSEHEAKNALRATNNNLERALHNLKRVNNNPSNSAVVKEAVGGGKGAPIVRNAGGKSESLGRRNNSSRDEVPSKPATTNVSLFDFLTDKFPIASESSTTGGKSKTSTSSSGTNVTAAATTAPTTSSKSFSATPVEQKKQPDFTIKSESFRQNHRNNYNEKNSSSMNKRFGESSNANANSQDSRGKFENNLSSSFAANRYSNNPVDQDNRKDYKSYQNTQNNSSHNNNMNSNSSSNPRDGNNSSYNNSQGRRGASGSNNRNSSERSFRNQPNEERKFPPREFRNSRSQQMRHQPLHQQTSSNSNPNSKNSRQTNDSRNYGEDRSPSERGNFKKSYSGRNQNTNQHNNGNNNYSQQQKQGSEDRYNNSNNNGGSRFNQQNSQQRKNNYQNQNQQSSQNSSSTYNSGVNSSNQQNVMSQVIESTAKMRIDSSHQQQQQQHHQQQQNNSQQQQQMPQAHQTQQQQAPQQNQNQNQNSHRNQNRQTPQHQSSVVMHGSQSQNSSQYSNSQKQPLLANEVHYSGPQYLPSPPPTSIQQPQIASNRTSVPATFSRPLQNGLPYETSEPIPLNVIKGQSINMIPTSIHQVVPSVVSSQPPQPQPTHVILATTSHSPGSVFAAGPTPQAAYIIPSPPLPQATQLTPAVLQQAHQTPYGIIPSTEIYPWKAGDRCLAKYWDDGRYYDAEVTAVADTTCVVYYLGYGNHEEVLKSDLLPVADFSPQAHAVKSFAPTSLAPVATAAIPPPQQQITFQAAPAHVTQIAPVHTALPVTMAIDDRNLAANKKRFKKNIVFQSTYVPPNQRNKTRPNFS